mgnify:CR=1 FL=1
MGIVFCCFPYDVKAIFNSEISLRTIKILKGVYNVEDPPLSIPNREVKLHCADGTAIAVGE